jgi:hypothetical protein
MLTVKGRGGVKKSESSWYIEGSKVKKCQYFSNASGKTLKK